MGVLEREIDEAVKDLKSAKLVEDQIMQKQLEIDHKKKKLELLKREFEKLKAEEDPANLEKELQKVKVKIEAAVKVRNGIEHMRDMYSSGSQKDPKQAILVEQQIESKKREIEALRRFEQRLIERIVASKGSQTTSDQAAPQTSVVRAKVLYDITASSDTELSAAANDVIVILDSSAPDWWEAELSDGRKGFVPASYVDILPQEVVAEPTPAPAAEIVDKTEYSHLYPKARVIYDHAAGDEGELTLTVGDTLTVHSWDDQYWWQGELNGTSGYFPCHCVQWIEPEGSAAPEIVVGESGSYYEEHKPSGDQQEAPPAAEPEPEPAPAPAPAYVPEIPPAEEQPPQVVEQPISAEPTPVHVEHGIALPGDTNTDAAPVFHNAIPLPDAEPAPVYSAPVTHVPAASPPAPSVPVATAPTPVEVTTPPTTQPTPQPPVPTPAVQDVVPTPAIKDAARPVQRPPARTIAGSVPPTIASRPLPSPAKTAAPALPHTQFLSSSELNEAIQSHGLAFIAQLQQLTAGIVANLEQKHSAEVKNATNTEQALITQLQAQVSALQASLNSTTKEKEMLQQEVESLRAENITLRSENTELKNTVSRVEKEQAESSARVEISRKNSSVGREDSFGSQSSPPPSFRERSDSGSNLAQNTTQDQATGGLSFAHRRSLFEQAARKRT